MASDARPIQAGEGAIGVSGAVPEVSAWRASLTRILVCVAREALQGEELDALLKGICDCLVAELPVPIASVILLDETGDRFIHWVCAGELMLDETPIASGWPVTRGAAGRCARLGVPQLIRDVATDPDYLVGNPEVRSEYLVPIRHGKRLHGVLNIESRDPRFFDADTCAVFDAVADLVAASIHFARVAEDLQLANRKLEQLSMIDGLTGIANRRRFDAHLQTLWARSAGEGRPLALLIVDADHFKALNDSLGHLQGDECLRELARICDAHAHRPDDLAARFGGEELVLLLPERTPQEAAASAESLRAAVAARGLPHPASPAADHVTVSVGGAVLHPRVGDRAEDLFATADRALYGAKAQGRNRVVMLGDAGG